VIFNFSQNGRCIYLLYPAYKCHVPSINKFTSPTLFFPRVKALGRDIDHLPTSRAHVQEKVVISLSLFSFCAFIACYRMIFTFTFYVITSAWTGHTRVMGPTLGLFRLSLLHKIATNECQCRTNKDCADGTMKLETGNINKCCADGLCSSGNDEIRCVFKQSEDDLSEVLNHRGLRCKSPRSLKRLAAS
jgi:hypothetical protein